MLRKKNRWEYILFFENPGLYLPVLEGAKKRAIGEVSGISKILQKYKIPSNAKILDFSCGIGRHSVNLALRGYEVVGYDPSPLYIEKAKIFAEIKYQILHNDRDSIAVI